MLNLSNTESQTLERNGIKVPNINLSEVDDISLANGRIASELIRETYKEDKIYENSQLPLYEGTAAENLPNDRPWEVFGDKIADDKSYRYTHVSLFTGCGGFDLGFRQAGFKTIFANDLDPEACQTYRYNIGEIIEGDLRKIEIPEFKNDQTYYRQDFRANRFRMLGRDVA